MLAILLGAILGISSGTAGASQEPTSDPAGVPESVRAALPEGAEVLTAFSAALEGREQGPQWIVLFQPTNGLIRAAHLAVFRAEGDAWALAHRAEFEAAISPGAQLIAIDEWPGLALLSGIGAHGSQLMVVRWNGTAYATVFERSSNTPGLTPMDLDGDGVEEIVDAWSPYCGGYAASPKLVTVFAWGGQSYREATAAYPSLVLGVEESVAAAMDEIRGLDQSGRACLHWSLGYLADRSGRPEVAAEEYERAQELDPAYTPDAFPPVVGFESAYGRASRVLAQAAPIDAVQHFYTQLDQRDFTEAWEMLSPDYRSTLDRTRWVEGYEPTLSIALISANLASRSEREAVVEVEIIAEDQTDEGTVAKRFSGAWTLVSVSGLWTLSSPRIAELQP
jgi:tetratricopeptide (TPR) repeat protein